MTVKAQKLNPLKGATFHIKEILKERIELYPPFEKITI
jgi:hypothetical protein